MLGTAIRRRRAAGLRRTNHPRLQHRQHATQTQPAPVGAPEAKKSRPQAVAPVKGMRDLFGLELRRHQFVIDNFKKIASLYGYEEIQTPIVEYEPVFLRTLGDTSEVVKKEMYRLVDKTQDRLCLCLRPESTAGVMRAYVHSPEQLQQKLPQRLYYYGPMFRYERPQKGRYRQFHQVGVELLGPSQVSSDVSMIEMTSHFLQSLNIKEDFTLELNSLGDEQSRINYKQALSEFLKSKYNYLSNLSKERFDRGSVLRILDSKEEADKKLLEGCPVLLDYLSSASRKRWEFVLKGLDNLKIAYNVNHKLVRGLDYYNDTCFEFVSKESGSAILGGGRYDDLCKVMGGPNVSGVGWAAGIERLALLVKDKDLPALPLKIAMVALYQDESEAEVEALNNQVAQLAGRLRRANVAVQDFHPNASIKLLKQADKQGVDICVLISKEDVKGDVLRVKYLKTGKQQTLKFTDFVTRFNFNITLTTLIDDL